MEAKGFSLAILGDEGVGKTSFCNIYVNKSFNPNEKPTVGGEYFQKILYDNNATVKVDIYDSSGNPKAKKIVKYLYKDARSIILMFNLNKKSTFECLNSYLEDIRMNSVEDPIIYLVGNFAEEASSKRQVTKEEIKEFENSNCLKYFEISCKLGKGIDLIMNELIKEILLTEKYFTSTIDKDISDMNVKESSEKEIEKIGKNLKNFYKDNKDKKYNLLRCQNCHQLLFVKFRNTYNEVSLICTSCKTEENVKILEIDKYLEKLSETIVCFECMKQKEERIKLEYCNKCKHYVCPPCKKKIVNRLRLQGSEIHNLFPYFIIDVECFDDHHKMIGHCKTCNKSFCIKCYDSHKAHENTFFDDILEKLKEENDEELKKERVNLNKFKENFEDCINSIKNQVTAFIYLKNKEIKLKEQLLSQLTNIQFNYQLIETIKNMKYMKAKKYDKNSSWYQKLTDIFEVIGQPIQIKNINITKNHKSSIIPKIIQLKHINEEEEEKKEENANSYGLFLDKTKEVTDFCSMNDYKYLGISFNNGTLELYEDFSKNQNPIHSFEIMDESEGIKSIYKSTRNINNFFFCGKEKIKNIEFYDGFKNMRTIMEIIDKKKIFTFSLEQDNCIISCDSNNKLIIYDKESNKIGDITESIDKNGSKGIFSLNEIMNNLIYITFNKTSENAAPSSYGRNSYFFNNEMEEPAVDVSVSRTSIKDQVELGSKIIELDENTHGIKREHILSEKQHLIGTISERLILIRDDGYKSVILFDAKTFKNVQRFYFEDGEKPIFCSDLNRRGNLTDFVLISDEMKMILQNIYDEEHINVTQISGLKINAKNEEIEKEIKKDGKILHIPFKGFIKYLGDNSFVVINY
jgi:small GTP-binding protein